MNPESKGVQRKKLESLILIGAFLGILFAVSLWNVLTADQSFSEQENRVLSQRPELSTQSLLSGEFMQTTKRIYPINLPEKWPGQR